MTVWSLILPLLIGIDAIHGNGMVRGTTIYPSPITLASSFNDQFAFQAPKWRSIMKIVECFLVRLRTYTWSKNPVNLSVRFYWQSRSPGFEVAFQIRVPFWLGIFECCWWMLPTFVKWNSVLSLVYCRLVPLSYYQGILKLVSMILRYKMSTCLRLC